MQWRLGYRSEVGSSLSLSISTSSLLREDLFDFVFLAEGRQGGQGQKRERKQREDVGAVSGLGFRRCCYLELLFSRTMKRLTLFLETGTEATGTGPGNYRSLGFAPKVPELIMEEMNNEL